MSALQIVLPCLLLSWLWFRRPSGRISWLFGVLLTLGVIAVVSLAVPWLSVPAPVRYVYLAVWVVTTLRSWGRRRPAALPGARGVWDGLSRWVFGLTTAAAWMTAALAVDGRRVPAGDVLDLARPLAPGIYLVASGGSRLVVNPHLSTLGAESRYLPWRGQSYGVDLVQVDGFGRRARASASPNLADYLIYGQHVIAPCAGAVVAAVDGRPDMVVGMRDPDRSQLAGNHVVLQCGEFEVLLGHLQPGSVRVGVGEGVKTGDLLGFVGNSGNTDEPHLHISAQRRTDGQPAVGGDPVWITVNGTFLVRNDRIRWE